MISHVFVQNMNNNMRLSTMYKGPKHCDGSESAFAGATAVRMFDHPRFAADSPKAAEELAGIPMLATTGTAAFYMSVPFDEFPVLPFHPAVLAEARRVLADLAHFAPLPPPSDKSEEEERGERGPVTLCIHVRREDMKAKQPPLQRVVEDTLRTAAANRVTKLFVAHNADPREVSWLRERLPAGTQLGCDGTRWPLCQNFTLQIAVEQAVCSLADHFLGSTGSTFTGTLLSQPRSDAKA
jgi:hypothetical protein